MNLFQHVLAVLAVCLTLLTRHSSTQVHSGTKSTKIGFNVGTHFRNEIIGENGYREGEYGFRTPDGCLHVVRYEVVNARYRVLGTNKKDCARVPTKLPVPIKKPLLRNETLKPFTTKQPTANTRTTTTEIPVTSSILSTIITRSATSARKTTTPRTRKPRKQNAGKQLEERVDPPPDMERPKVLSPDDPEPIYSFGYEAPGHGHVQAGLPDGSKKGEFFFDSPDGWRRFVTYEANEKGFYPKMRRERIPDWENSPLNPKNRYRSENQGNGGGSEKGRQQKEDEQGGLRKDDRVSEGEGKQLNPISPPSNGCPYYFYTNTKINYHWERCLLNETRVGEYGKLAADGFEEQVSYYADGRGYHPRITRTPLTSEQQEAVAAYTEGVFIIPNIEEEKQDTEQRIQEWISQNQARIDNPL